MDCVLKPKTCCFFLKLRTGCYIIAVGNLLLGVLRYLDEFFSAINVFHMNRAKGVIAVTFIYDLEPSTTIFLSLALIYGLYKENKCLIFSGVNLMTYYLISNVDKMTFIIIYWAQGWMHTEGLAHYALESASLSVVEGASLIVILNHWRQLKANGRNKPNQVETKELETNEFENPMSENQMSA